MDTLHIPRRILAALLLTAGLAGSSGCLTMGCKPTELPSDCLEACQGVPPACRGKVYVFLIDGFDPFGFCHVADVRKCLLSAGFTKVYNGHCYHTRWFADEMRTLHTDEPDARFVVVGFASGVEAAKCLADAVADGVTIDLFATIDAPCWSKVPLQQPENVQSVLSLQDESLLGGPAKLVANASGDSVDAVEAHQPPVRQLTAALITIAGSVPVSVATPISLTTEAELQSPRPLVTRSATLRDDWDFLKPVVRLGDAAQTSETNPPGERTAAR
jgi:hypothetical protein